MPFPALRLPTHQGEEPKNLNLIMEVTVPYRRKKYLSAGLAGVLCSTALVGLTMAQPAGGKNNLNLPGLRERPATPDNSFTRMFPELPPLRPAD